MAQAKQDANGVIAMLGVSSSDGKTTVPVQADATKNALMIDTTGGITDGGAIAKRDSNRRPVLMAVSSDDGTTPVMVYVNPANGNIKAKIS